MRTLYFDCFSGVSGDMLLGALVELGVDLAALELGLASLNLEGVSIAQRRVTRSSLSAVKVDVTVGGRIEGPDGVVDAGTHDGHRHHHGKPGAHLAVHQHGDHGHGRGLVEILELIDASSLPDVTKQRAGDAFRRLGDAEARMHGSTPEGVHFHEVGAADAIVDVVGSLLAFEMLGIERFVCSPINVGSGTVTFSHGTFPVPAPATADLLRGVPVYAGDVHKELTTPTGAVVVTTVAGEYGALPEMRIERIGYGAGGRDLPDRPNVLRLFLGETTTGATPQDVAVLEAAIDDMTPEALAYFAERALAEGALDVYAVPAQMKKNRPGVAITLLCEPADLDRFCRLVFTETTTLGLRHRLSERRVLERERIVVDTAAGPIHVKVGSLEGRVASASPEFDDCRAAALRANLPLTEVQAMAMAAFRARGEQP